MNQTEPQEQTKPQFEDDEFLTWVIENLNAKRMSEVDYNAY